MSKSKITGVEPKNETIKKGALGIPTTPDQPKVQQPQPASPPKTKPTNGGNQDGKGK